MNFNFVAVFQVDRSYRGKIPKQPVLHFLISDGVMGHDCIDFQPAQYWVVFAKFKNGKMIPADDCLGALKVSPLLGPNLGQADWSTQMEADFIAGLDDCDAEARILSLQRLGGLKLASSRPVLHRVIAEAKGEEKGWAIYAAMRTGDVTVLPLVKSYLASSTKGEAPEWAMTTEFRNMKDPTAVPGLLDILANVSDDATRQQVLVALVDNIGDPRAIPALGESLSSSDVHILDLAVTGLGKIAHADACNISDERNDETLFQSQVATCKAWWDATGSHQRWNQN